MAAVEITRRALLCGAAAAFLPKLYALEADAARMQRVLDETLRGSAAIAVVMHRESGRMLATRGNVAQPSAPGSVLKPLVLFSALEHGLVTSATTVFCKRDLHIGGRPYPCAHPQSAVSFNAQEALAYSCNTWFASVALRFAPARLVEALRVFGLHDIVLPGSPGQSQLLALGLEGIAGSTLEIAAAYRMLGSKMEEDSQAKGFAKPVMNGLRDSVSFGMAHNADAPGLEVSGKTGTANSPREFKSHGWFAGFATLRSAPIILSLYLPQANGGDAAHLARSFFLAV